MWFNSNVIIEKKSRKWKRRDVIRLYARDTANSFRYDKLLWYDEHTDDAVTRAKKVFHFHGPNSLWGEYLVAKWNWRQSHPCNAILTAKNEWLEFNALQRNSVKLNFHLYSCYSAIANGQRDTFFYDHRQETFSLCHGYCHLLLASTERRIYGAFYDRSTIFVEKGFSSWSNCQLELCIIFYLTIMSGINGLMAVVNGIERSIDTHASLLGLN